MSINVDAFDSETKRWFAYAIAGMIASDGRVDDAEVGYLKEAIEFLEDPNEVTQLVNAVKTNRSFNLSPLNCDSKQAFGMLKHIAGLSISDGKLTSHEIKFFKDTGRNLGFPQEVLNKIITMARDKMESEMPTAMVEQGTEDEAFRVLITSLTSEECMFRSPNQIGTMSRIKMRFEDKQEIDTYQQVTCHVQGSNVSKVQVGSYVVKAQFNHAVKEAHGIPQILEPEKYKRSVKVTSLNSSNNCMMGKYVECGICGQTNVASWILRSKTMMMKSNIFGIPVYDKPMPTKDHCDYHLYSVTTCQKCFFASTDIKAFKSEKNPMVNFNVNSIKETWMNSIAKRKAVFDKEPVGFFSETRNINQTMAGYDFALEAYKKLAEKDETPDSARKVVSFLMIKAELLMSNGKRKEAEASLKEVPPLLEPLFEKIDGAVIIKSAMLLCMIYIYFKNLKGVGQYIAFLASYDQDGKLEPGSDEFKALKVNKNIVDSAYADRADYAFDKLTSFHLPK